MEIDKPEIKLYSSALSSYHEDITPKDQFKQNEPNNNMLLSPKKKESAKNLGNLEYWS